MSADDLAADAAAPGNDQALNDDEQAWLDEQIHNVDMDNIGVQLCGASVGPSTADAHSRGSTNG